VLLVGGYDKQVDLAPLAEEVAGRAKAVALMGQTAEALGCLIESLPESDGLPVKECRSFDEAFHWAVGQSQEGDVVLLSPGCASYDWFANYAERGRRFTELAHSWRREAAQA
jgi:UDP-N-acetylmuramoylalanine--D-glutamate ligase